VVENRVLIYPLGRFSGPQDIPPMLRNDVRQEILQSALSRSERMDAPLVEGSPYLAPYAFSDGETRSLYLVNASLDAVTGVSLRFLETDGAYAVSALPSRGEPSAFCACVSGGRCALDLSIGPMESVLLTFTPAGA